MSEAHEAPNYMQIFFILVALTVAEVAVTYVPLPWGAMAFGLVVMAVAKAVLVAMYFMHLRFETRTLGIIAVTPAVLLVWFVLITYPDAAWRLMGFAIPG